MDKKKLDALKAEIIKLALHHKDHCDGECNISLFIVRRCAEDIGIEFTDEEKRIFI